MRTILQRLLPSLGAVDLDALQALFRARTHDKGDVLLAQGGRWDSVYGVESGTLRMHLIAHDGKDFNKNFHEAGALVLPITAEMEHEPALFAISALERSVVWHARVPEFRARLAALGRWEPLRTALLERLVGDKLRREHDLLTLDGTARYLRLCRERPTLAATVPVAQLASFLGLTDVSLSRIRRRLKARGDD